jgi:hypothetical protein
LDVLDNREYTEPKEFKLRYTVQNSINGFDSARDNERYIQVTLPRKELLSRSFSRSDLDCITGFMQKVVSATHSFIEELIVQQRFLTITFDDIRFGPGVVGTGTNKGKWTGPLYLGIAANGRRGASDSALVQRQKRLDVDGFVKAWSAMFDRLVTETGGALSPQSTPKKVPMGNSAETVTHTLRLADCAPGSTFFNLKKVLAAEKDSLAHTVTPDAM